MSVQEFEDPDVPERDDVDPEDDARLASDLVEQVGGDSDVADV